MSYGWSAWGWGKIVKPLEVKSSQYNKEEINIGDGLGKGISDLMNSRVRIGNKKAIITKVEITGIEGFERLVFQTGERVIIKIHVLFNQDIEKNFSIGFHIKGRYCDIFGTNNQLNGIQVKPKRKGDRITAIFSLPINLAKGIYSIRVGCTIIHSEENIEILDRYYDYLYFTVLSAKKFVGIVDIDTKVTIIDG